MPGIEWFTTLDNSSFIKSVEQIQSSVQHASKVLSSVGRDFDVSNVMEQVDALTKVIRSNEEAINHSKKMVADWMRQAEEARGMGDFATAETIQLDITQALNDIEQYNKDLTETKQALLEVMNIGGDGTKAPMLFDSQEAYDEAQRLKAEIASLQAQIAEFDGSPSGLEELRGKLSENEAELRKVEEAAVQNAAQLGSAGALAAEVSSHYYELTEKIREQQATVGELTIKYQEAEQAMKKALEGGNTQEISNARVQYDAYAKGLENARNELVKLQTSQQDFHKKMQQMSSGVSEAGSQIVSVFKNIAAVAGVSFTLNQAKQFVNEVVSIRSAMQDLETGMQIFLGSQEAAASFNDKLKGYSMKSLFHYNELMAVSQQLLGVGYSAEDAMKKIDQLANIAAATHASLSNVVSMYIRAQQMGSVMNRQLATWGQLGVDVKGTLKGMGEEVTKSTVSFEQLDKVINNVTSPSGKFANAQQMMLGNISAEIDTYKNKMELMFNEIGEEYQDYIVGAIQGGQWLVENYKEIGEVIMDVIAAYGAYRAALITVVATQKLAAFWENASAVATRFNTAAKTGQVASVTTSTVAWRLATASIKENTVALARNTAAALTNPYVLLGAAIAALTYGVYKLATADDAETAARKRANEEAKKYADTLEERKNKINELIAKLQDPNQTEVGKNKAWAELTAFAPQLVEGYTQAEFAAKSFDNTQKTVNQHIENLEYDHAVQEVERLANEVENAKKKVSGKAGGGLIEKIADFFNKKDVEVAINELKIAQEKLKALEEQRDKAFEPKKIEELDFDKLLSAADDAWNALDKVDSKKVNPEVDASNIEHATGWARGMIDTLGKIDRESVSTKVDKEQLDKAIESAQGALQKIVDIDNEVASPDVKREKIVKAEKDAQHAVGELEKLGAIIANPQVNISGYEKTLSQLKTLWGYFKKVLGLEGETPKVVNKGGNKANVNDYKTEIANRVDAANSDNSIKALLKSLNTKKENAKYGTDERKFLEQQINKLQEKQKRNNENATKNAQDAAKRREKVNEDSLQKLREQFKKEQEVRRSIAAARIADIENDAIREVETEKEASRKKWEDIRSSELSELYKQYEEAKKQFDIKNKNKKKVFTDTEQGQTLAANIKAYVDYYSQRNKIASEANEELSKDGKGIKIFNEDALNTDTSKLKEITALLTGIRDKKVRVDVDTTGAQEQSTDKTDGGVQTTKNVTEEELKLQGFTKGDLKKLKDGKIAVEDVENALSKLSEVTDFSDVPKDVTKMLSAFKKTTDLDTLNAKLQIAKNFLTSLKGGNVSSTNKVTNTTENITKNTVAINQVGELPTIEDKVFTVTARYNGEDVKNGLAEIPQDAEIVVSTTLEDTDKFKDISGETEIIAHVNREQYDELVKEYGQDIVQKVDIDTSSVRTGLQAVNDAAQGENIAIAIKTTGESLDAIKEKVADIDKDATINIHTNADALPKIQGNEVVQVTYKANTQEIEAAKDKLPTDTTITYTLSAETRGIDEAAKTISDLPSTKTFSVNLNDNNTFARLTEIGDVTFNDKQVNVVASTEEAAQQLRAIGAEEIADKVFKVDTSSREAIEKLSTVNGFVVTNKSFTVTANTEQARTALAEIGTAQLQDRTFSVTMKLDKTGSVDMPKDGEFTVKARFEGKELNKIKDIPKEADITINTKLGDIKKPDIPKDATINISTAVTKDDYEKLKKELGEEAVQVITTKVEGDTIPEVKDQKMNVIISADASQLNPIKTLLGKDVTAQVNTKAGKVSLPKIPTSSTVDVKYNVDSTQLDEAKEKVKDGTITYNIDLQGKEALDSLGDKEINITANVPQFNTNDVEKFSEALRTGVVTSKQLSDLGLSDTFIKSLKDGTATADMLTKAIELLNKRTNELAESENKVKGLRDNLDPKDKAILENQEKAQAAEESRQERERQRQRLANMREYFEQYGSLEQKRQSIIAKFEEDIDKARQAYGENSPEVLMLQEQKNEKMAQMSFENITKGIDWGSLFNGIGTMSKQMMQQTMQQLKAYTKTDTFRQSGAENQEKVMGLIAELRQYLGSNDATMSDLASAMIQFNEAVSALDKAQQAEAAASKAYTDAQNALIAGENAVKEGKMSPEQLDALKLAVQTAKDKFDGASRAVVNAQKDVQVFGSKLNQASDAVVNFVSKFQVAVKNSGIEDMPGGSNVTSAQQNIDKVIGQINKQTAENLAKRNADSDAFKNRKADLDIAVQEGTITQEAANEQLINAFGSTGDKITTSITSGLNNLGGSIGGMLGSMSGLLALPKLIVDMSKAIKDYVVGILDGITEFLRLEWLSDLIVSIFDAIAGVVDAILDLPESIAYALEAIVSGIGNAVGNIVGRIGSVFGLGGGLEDHEDEYQERISELTSILEANSKALEKNTEAIKNNKDYKVPTNLRQNLDSALEQTKVDRQTKMEVARSIADDSYDGSWYKAWSDGYHSWIYERNDTNDKWDTFNAFNEALQKGGSSKSVKSAGDLFSLSPEEIQLLMEFSPQAWKDMFRDVGSERDPQEVKKWLEEYASTAGKERELWLDWYQGLTKISFDSLRDNFKSNILDMSKDAKGFVDDFNNMIAQSTVEVMMNIKTKDGKSFTDKLKDWQIRWGQAVESDNKLTQAEKEALQAEYEQLTQEALEMREQVKDITGDLSKSSKEQQSATFNSAKNITYEQADSLIGIEIAKQIILEQIKAWLYKQDFTTPEIDAQEIEAPNVEIPAIQAPVVDIPAMEAPTIDTPNVNVEVASDPVVNMPTIQVPEINVPTMEQPQMETPTVEVPEINVPSFEAPKIEAPKIDMPTIESPKVEIPAVETPKVEVPAINVPETTIPTIEAPSIEIPETVVEDIEAPIVNIPSTEQQDIDIPEAPLFDYARIDEIIALLQEQDGSELESAAQSLFQASQQQLGITEDNTPTDELLEAFKASYGKLMVSVKNIASKTGVTIPTNSLQGLVPQQTYGMLEFEDIIASIAQSIGEKLDITLPNTSDYQPFDEGALVSLLTGSTVNAEQNALQVALISQNLQAMKDLTASHGTVIAEIRQLIWDGNNTRESMLSAMKEHYENFDSKMNKVLNEIQNI